jgi:hypothetical protein
MDYHPDWLVASHRAAERANITYRQLDYWCRTGAVVPLVDAKGTGSQRLFGEDQIAMLKVMGVIASIVSRVGDIIARAWRCLDNDPSLLAREHLYVSPTGEVTAEPTGIGIVIPASAWELERELVSG